MSFRQPAVSIYDIIDALGGQPGNRSYQGQRRPRYRDDYTMGTGYHPFVATIPGYNGCYYSIPRQGSYYEPQYFFNGEELPSGERHGQEEEQDETDNNRGRNLGNRNASLPTLFDLLQAVIPAAYEPDLDTDEEHEAAQKGSDSAVASTSGASGPDKDAKTSEKKETAEDAKEQPKDKISSPQSKNSKHSSKTGEQPVLKRRLSASLVHPEGRSAAPDPLQVSKPEIRLDLPFSPEVNVYDAEKEYIVVLALPGANSQAFSVDYHPSSHELQITGNIDKKKLNLDPRLLKISELKSGAFERTIKFPALPKIKDEDIKASYSNGLLQIKVPKILNDSSKPKPKRRIVIEDLPDEELEFEKNPNPVETTLD